MSHLQTNDLFPVKTFVSDVAPMSNFAFKHWNTWQSYLLSRMILPQRRSGQCLQRMNLWLRNPCHFYVTWNLKGLSLSKVCMWRHQIIPEWHDVMLYRCWYWWQMDADFTLVFVSACIKINIASIHKHCLHHPCLSCYVIMIFVFISEKCQNVRHMQTVDWLRQEKTIHSQEDFSKV